jgi:hypothetical protein
MLRLDGEKFGVTEQNPEDSSQTAISEEVLRLANNSSFLRIDHTDDSRKIILVFAGDYREYLLKGRLFFNTILYICKLQVSVAHRMYSNLLTSGSVCTATV